MRTYIALAVLLFSLAPQWALGADQVQFTGATDVSTGPWYYGSPDLVDQQNVCVFKVGADDSWQVTGSGDGPGSTFIVQDISSNTLPVEISINNNVLTPTVALTGQMNADLASSNCSGSPNQIIKVRIDATDLSSATPGTYTGTITLQAAP